MTTDNHANTLQAGVEQQQKPAELLRQTREHIQGQLAGATPELLAVFTAYEDALGDEQRLFPLDDARQAGAAARERGREPQAALWEFMKDCLLQATQDGLDDRRNSLFGQLSRMGLGDELIRFTELYRQANSVNAQVERAFLAGYQAAD